ncbi:PorV/PorQ family protein [bacterium]|nr:PorV/PorQ family protein [bacterium]
MFLKYKKTFFYSAIVILFTPILLSASPGDAGTEGPFAFGVEARAVSLGRAYTGIAEDASVVYWNPAGLAYLEQKEIASLYTPLYDRTDYGFLSFVYPISKLETIGIGLMGMTVRDIPKTDEYDNRIGEFYDLQLQLLLGYSRVWWNNLAAGICIKLYHHTLDTYNGTGFGMDAGVYYDAKDFLPGLTAGLKFTNALPPAVTLISEPDVYPLNMRLGAAYRYSVDQAGDHKLMLSLEGEKPEFAGFKLHAGLEYKIIKMFAVRAGWNNDHITAGAGVNYWDWRLDYALTFQKDFGNIHLISAGWRFGLSISEVERQKGKAILAELTQSKSQEYNQRGLHCLKKGQYKKAVDEFEKAVSWVENSREITNNLNRAQAALNKQAAREKYQAGKRFFKKKFYIDALLAWRETAKLNPKYPKIKTRMASAKKAMEKQLIRQKTRIAKKVSKKERKSQNLFREGVGFYLDGEFARAIEKWERALKINPGLKQAKVYLAKAQEYNQPKLDKIENRDLNTAERRQVDQYYEQGLLKYRQRKFIEARNLWRLVLKQDPDHKDAQRGMERIKAILNVFEKRGIK